MNGWNEMTRRDAVKMGLVGAAGLTVSGSRVLAADQKAKKKKRGTGKSKPEAKAKSVIQIWMWGGPSHLDTFDPKPGAGEDYCGPYKKPISTNADGVQICEMLPKLAKHADKYSIIRSMTHGINGHETASYMVQTGHEPGRLVYPSMGAVVSVFKGYEHGYDGLVPPYIVLTQPQGRFSESGFLGPKYKPFSTGGDPARTPFAVEGIVARGISDKRQKDRRELMHSLDTLGRVMGGNEKFAELDECEEEAYDLMFGDARKLFDLGQEKEAMRERYGMNTFGQSCLAARRLVEHGVPYITINYRGWDTHKQHFETMARKLPEMDQAMSALLGDLSERGLLDSTIVWWGGEFGRGPKIQKESPWNGGRSHHGKCFSSLVAGGGFKGGRVIGASDEKGMEVAERAVYPKDLIGSMYTLLGIDPDGKLPNPRGLDVKVMPRSEKGEGRLTEIM
ncbi:hypothetical protein STSP2_01027 [Anaerohalosphaera lusitana]|uniref:DUF1501 domain-containing protein n=1 Tax=Anaerohalosphaera lusitana TaxID=1936003 RepID=A0A1U9NJ76_9BACT|nr:DUF1501 domain-containing protein [Anaerohalosphaera lusitana]AQT67875.1 hypothetical protein STSP2_01027 [Anaerohalosphaera lusitana]